MTAPAAVRRVWPLVGLQSTTGVGVALGGITLLALLIRLYSLTGYGIWWDEAYHIQLVQLPTVGAMLDAVLSNPPSDPLYVLLLRAWVAGFGHGDAAVRLLSVGLSTATLPATYWLGRQLAGRGAGLLGAGLLAVLPYAVELGQEAALYALAALTTTLALAAGWQWRASGRGAGAYVLLGVVAVYSHYVVAAILLGFALLALHPAAGPRRVTWRAWLVALGAIGLAWGPWLLALGVHWLDSTLPRATLAHAATVDEVLGALIQFTSGSGTLLQGRRLPEALGLLAGAVLLTAGWRAGQAAERRGLRLVILLSGVIFLIPAGLSALTGRWLFVPHFMLFLLPALCVVLAAGAVGLLTWTGARRGAVLVGALLGVWLVAQGWGLMLYYRYPPHGADGLRDLAALLTQERRPDDAVLITPPILTPPLRQYYNGPLRGAPQDFDLRAVYLPLDDPTWNARTLATLTATAAGHPRFWLVYRAEQDAGGGILRAVQQRYQQLAQQTYGFAQLYLFANP